MNLVIVRHLTKLPLWSRCTVTQYMSTAAISLSSTKCCSNQRCYSKFVPHGAKQNPYDKLKISTFVIVSGIFALSMLYRNIQKKKTEKSGTDNVVIYRDPFCKGQSGTLLRIGQFWLPSEFFKEKNKMSQIREFECRSDDIVVASFPKSGTTWIQEIIYMIMNSDHDESNNSTIEERFPYIEYVYPGLKALTQSGSPRYLKTHLPYELLPHNIQNGNSKVIYIARNAKDVSVSYYHFIKMLTITKYSGKFEDFFKSFLDAKVGYGPWCEHVLQYWNKRHQRNIIFITYEDLQEKPVHVIKELAAFLGKSVGDKRAVYIAYHCSFNQMASNPLVNYSWWDTLGIRDVKRSPFMREGKVGDWRNYYTSEMINQIDCSFIEKTRNAGLVIRDQ